jgi:hypothetical protein
MAKAVAVVVGAFILAGCLSAVDEPGGPPTRTLPGHVWMWPDPVNTGLAWNASEINLTMLLSDDSHRALWLSPSANGAAAFRAGPGATGCQDALGIAGLAVDDQGRPVQDSDRPSWVYMRHAYVDGDQVRVMGGSSAYPHDAIHFAVNETRFAADFVTWGSDNEGDVADRCQVLIIVAWQMPTTTDRLLLTLGWIDRRGGRDDDAVRAAIEWQTNATPKRIEAAATSDRAFLSYHHRSGAVAASARAPNATLGLVIEETGDRIEDQVFINYHFRATADHSATSGWQETLYGVGTRFGHRSGEVCWSAGACARFNDDPESPLYTPEASLISQEPSNHFSVHAYYNATLGSPATISGGTQFVRAFQLATDLDVGDMGLRLEPVALW